VHAVKLTRSFDPSALHGAYLAVQAALESTPAGYPGEGHIGWSSICVHSAAGGASPALAAAPYLRDVLDELQLRLRLVRLLRLEPGGIIREHQDSFLSKRIVRLHVPIVTHPDVEFYLGGVRCRWNAGELWYGNFSLPHRGVNNGPRDRIHLVIDATTDENLLRLFPAGQVPGELTQLADGADGELDQKVLERFAIDFMLPAGFQLPGLGYEALATPTEGCVRLVDSELMVFVNQQPLLKAVPASEDTLDLPGLGQQARLRFAFDDDAVDHVTLTLGAASVLTLQPRR
jgi:aspartyl/asparaginyl beta-hydroxylase (cupin superfamily)